MKIQKVTDASFAQYGKIVQGLDCSGLFQVMEHTPVPKDVVYVPSVEEMESTKAGTEFQLHVYGGLPIQIGYCNGNNDKLNGLEYHRSSEIDIAVTDLILLLGRQQDIEADDTYDTSKVEAFYVEKGTAVELYATTLHYAPCNATADGFRCVVILPEGTNTDIDFKLTDVVEDHLMTAKNKWLIAHEDAKIEGAFVGLKGENVTVTI